MCKKTSGLLVLLCSGAWANAQQPGYAVVSSGAGSPPEPAAIGGPMGVQMAQGPGGPVPGPMPGMGGPGMGYPMGGPGMGYPMGGPGMGYPMGGPGMGYPMGGLGMGGPGMAMPHGGVPDAPAIDFGLPTVGPTNTFGSESFWASMNYVAGWVNKPGLNSPLLTQGSVTDTHPGALGQPNTTVLFGNDQYKFGPYNGIEASVGVNLTDEWSLEASGLWLPTQNLNWRITSDANGNPLLARPVTNVQAGGIPGAFLTSVPGSVAGTTQIQASSVIWGVDGLAAYRFAVTPYLTGQFLIGYRNMELQEGLTIADSITPLTPSFTFLGNTVAPAMGTQIIDNDHFSTNNVFNGGEFGVRFNWQSGYDWFATTAYIKEALGVTSQTVSVGGSTTLLTAGAVPVTASGGVLAQSSNIGDYNHNMFSSITDGGFGIVITPWKYVRFEVGYSALFWSGVVRPGNQINPNVSYTQVPTSQTYTGPAAGNQPGFVWHQSNITMQTLTVGMTFYY